jgi:60 kDa SS-A/Ro ribonucleoprotein
MTYLQNQIEELELASMPAVDHWTRLERLLMLGNEAGTYSIEKRPLTVENGPATLECLKADGLRVVRMVVEISTGRSAPKNDPALFVLALASSPNFSDSETIAVALRALPEVAPTGTDLCSFAAFVESLRGWGRGLRSAVAEWYLSKPAFELAYQMLSSQHRNGWSHRDLLRLSHPKAATPTHNALFQWAVDGGLGHLASAEILSGDLRQIRAFELAKKSASEDEIVNLIEENRLTDAMIPSKWTNSARVWEALLPSLPYVELVRRLGKLTAVGLVQSQSPATALVVARLIDRKRIANSRIHPVALLEALLAYQGELSPVASIIGALDEAFYLAMQNVQPTGKRIYLALDPSASMHDSYCVMASATLAMVFARREPNCIIWPADITRQDPLKQVCEAIVREGRFSDPSLPMRDAEDRGLTVDAFVIVTANDRSVAQALERYRRSSGITAKLVVIAMAANAWSIANPNDGLQLNVAGFDATVPDVVAEFIKQPVAYARGSSVTEPRP